VDEGDRSQRWGAKIKFGVCEEIADFLRVATVLQRDPYRAGNLGGESTPSGVGRAVAHAAFTKSSILKV
jgi:hypothetical protein